MPERPRRRHPRRLTGDNLTERAFRATGSHGAAAHGFGFEVALVALVSIAVYAGTLSAGFVWDDHFIISANRQIRSLANLPALFTTHAFGGAGEVLGQERLVEYYRPIWNLTLALDHALWGSRPFGYHLSSVLLHAATSVAVLLLARLLLAGALPSRIAGLFFAVHPAHVEAVAWVSSRNEILASLFVVLSFLAYLRLRGSGGRANAMACLGAAVLALLSKETAIVIPILVLVWESVHGRGRPVDRLRWPLALGLVAIGYLALRSSTVQTHPDPHPLAWRLLTAPQLIADYLAVLIAPFRLSVFHDAEIVKHPTATALVPPLVALGLWLAAALLARGRQPILFIGLAWVLVALLPVCGIAVMLQPALMAERYLYLPSVGAALAVGALIEAAGRRGLRLRRSVTIGASLVLALFGLSSFQQSLVWRDDLTLMSRMVRDAPDAVTGHENLGVALERQGRLEEARREHEIAVRLGPSEPLRHRNLALVYGKLGRFEEAEREFRAALSLKPDDAEARYQLGWLLIKEERWEPARRELEVAVTLMPRHAPAHSALGFALMRLGRPDAAAREARSGTALTPDSPDAHFGLGILLGEQGKLQEAEGEFMTAVRLRPEWAQAHFNLGAMRARLGRADEARGSFGTALRLSPPGDELGTRAAAALRELGPAR